MIALCDKYWPGEKWFRLTAEATNLTILGVPGMTSLSVTKYVVSRYIYAIDMTNSVFYTGALKSCLFNEISLLTM